jgi:hypothetical protein
MQIRKRDLWLAYPRRVKADTHILDKMRCISSLDCTLWVSRLSLWSHVSLGTRIEEALTRKLDG